MSDNPEKNVRRFGRRDQKDKLEKPASLFPVDDDLPIPDEINDEDLSIPEDAINFDIDSLQLPDTDTEALHILSSLSDEVRAPVITPQSERYPPVAPVIEPDSQAVTSPTEAPPKTSHFFTNLLSLVLLVATVLNIIWFVIVWDNPQSVLNPLPPPTPFRLVTVIPDNNTVASDLPTPDASGQIFVVITDTPAPTAISTDSPFPFVSDPVLYAPNTNELECNWWSIAGTVTDLSGNPVSGYRIRVTGNGIDETVFSGASQAFGDGGYELPLVGTPQEAEFSVQLLTGQDVALSEPVNVTTRSDCDSNVTIINFIQNR